MTETLFRFSVIRPPLNSEGRYPPIHLAQASPFQTSLATALAPNPPNPPPTDPRDALDNICNGFISGPEFTQPNHDDDICLLLNAAIAKFDELIAQEDIGNSETKSALEQVLGASTSSFLSTHGISALKGRIKDSLVALRQIGVEETTGHVSRLSANLRLFETIEKVNTDSSFPFDGNDLSKWRSRPILASTLVEYKSILSDQKARTETIKRLTEQAAGIDKHIKSLYDRRFVLNRAMTELSTVRIKDQFTQPPQKWTPDPPPERFSKVSLDTQRLKFTTQLAEMSIKHLERTLNPGGTTRTVQTLVADDGDNKSAPGKIENAPVVSSDLSALVNLSKTMLNQFSTFSTQQAITAFEPLDVVPFSLTLSALENFSKTTTEILEQNDLDVTATPHHALIKRVQDLMNDNATQLNAAYRPYVSPRVTGVQMIGDVTIRKMSAVTRTWADAWIAGSTKAPSVSNMHAILDQREAPTLGKFTVLGRADLLVVKQQLVGYEGGDVAYIENVLSGETKSREMTRSEKTESETFLETETTTTKENEIGTSQRFEMSDESQDYQRDKIAESRSHSVCILRAVRSRDRTNEETLKAASEFSKEVTNKATEKIQGRVLQRQKFTKSIESIDKDVHRFSNTNGKGHVSGVYQWQNKVYEAQTWNYGQRTILDFMVPEPGAFLFDKAANPEAAKADDIKYIPPFTATLADITPEKYMEFAQTYGSPAQFSEKLTIEPGYRANKAYVQVEGVGSDGGPVQITVICGRRVRWAWIPTRDKWFSARMGDEEKEVSWGTTINYMSKWTVDVHVEVEATTEAMSNWRAKTWQKLKTAYDKLIEAQQAAVQAAKFNASLMPAGGPFQGRNPDANAAIMRDEMKKACISIITDQHFDSFNLGVRTSITQSNEANISEVNIPGVVTKGPFVRFFEQAFEWDQMTWLTKTLWFQRLDYKDDSNDPVFEKFMKAGYARANVPV